MIRNVSFLKLVGRATVQYKGRIGSINLAAFLEHKEKAAMPPARWFIARNKEKVGPFSASDLQQLASHGLLKPTEHVLVAGATKWVPASSVPGLFRMAADKKYWLQLAGQTRGPFVSDQVRAGLNSHQITLETLACADEDQKWMPVRRLPEFRDFKFDTSPLSPSRAHFLTGSMEFEEAALHLAGKSGDHVARLMSTLMDLKRDYADNHALVDHLDETIAVLRSKVEKTAR
jgi:hypothetical protein